MPSRYHTGTPRHFHSSTTPGTAWAISARTWASVSPRQSPSSAMRASISRDGSPFVTGLFGVVFFAIGFLGDAFFLTVFFAAFFGVALFFAVLFFICAPLLFAHDLIGKPVPTFPDHALRYS